MSGEAYRGKSLSPILPSFSLIGTGLPFFSFAPSPVLSCTIHRHLVLRSAGAQRALDTSPTQICSLPMLECLYTVSLPSLTLESVLLFRPFATRVIDTFSAILLPSKGTSRWLARKTIIER